ncbi:putative lipase C4A8.10 isoform X1 [Wolffia australiana]
MSFRTSVSEQYLVRGWNGMRYLVMGSASESNRYLRKTQFLRDRGRSGDSVRIQSSQMIRIDDEVQSSVSSTNPHHLVVMVNGIIGSANDWKYASEQFLKKLPGRVAVHRSQSNYLTLTFDGVDMMGERLAEEVKALVKNRPGLQSISFVAHSLGGLIARYAIGLLYEPPGRVVGLEPANFVTVATPHLGSRGHRQLPFLCGVPLLERSASLAAHFIVGRTGRHLFLTDSDGRKPPLLLQMVNDTDDIKFRSALTSFKRCVTYANADYDHMVGWRTSSIRRQHELPDRGVLLRNERYPHIVYMERREREISSSETSETSDLEEEMIRGLGQVPWERIDVSFSQSNQRFIAHSTIQVKTYWMNSDGADVIAHIIDRFLV